MSTIAVLGGGNIGLAIARGLVQHGESSAADIVVTRRHEAGLAELRDDGFQVTTDNHVAIQTSDNIFVCVQPDQVIHLLSDLSPSLDPARHRIISVATGINTGQIEAAIGTEVPIIRAMPNTAIAIGESMTCLSGSQVPDDVLADVQGLFNQLGSTLVIDEELMIPATALCACGVAFFLRAVRAASQGGIEIGFHAEDALIMAAQTARGAASLLLEKGRHPEREIDRVTTPMGCTIAGLNRMEHEGFSSALIRGIVTSSEKANTLGTDPSAERS